jgi:hypothetical protein
MRMKSRNNLAYFMFQVQGPTINPFPVLSSSFVRRNGHSYCFSTFCNEEMPMSERMYIRHSSCSI